MNDRGSMKLGRMALVALVAAGLAACAGVRDHRGYVADPQLVASIQPGVDNKDSVAKTLGRPTFAGTFNDADWYYVSRDTSSFAFRNPKVAAQTVLHVRFDGTGNVVAVDRTGKEKIATVSPLHAHTPTLGRKKSFFDELFGNIGTIAQPGLPGSKR